MRGKFLLFITLSVLLATGGYSMQRIARCKAKKNTHYYVKGNIINKKAHYCVADNVIFPQFCFNVARNEEEFKNFRSSPISKLFLDRATYDDGKEYLDLISSRSPEILNHIDTFRKNDHFGNPKVFNYGTIGSFSPDTLLYIKIAADLKQEFGCLDGLKIAEIGGGYGGLCSILSSLYSFKSYSLIDLPSSLELSQKYLQERGISNITFLKPDDPLNERYDFVISAYAFTELERDVQVRYIEKIIKNSKAGYLICNFPPKHYRVFPFPKAKLLKQLSELGVKQLPEEPLTGMDNMILVWNRSTNT